MISPQRGRCFRNQIAGGMNFSLAGIPYWNSDIGGFLPKEYGGEYPLGPRDPAYRELYVRWFQFGAFCPIFRAHGTDFPREIWQFGEPGDWAYDALVKYDHLRYRLLPYIYSVAWQVTRNHSTMMRALPMDFAGDNQTHDINNEYMFGPSFLVAPVTSALYYPREPAGGRSFGSSAEHGQPSRPDRLLFPWGAFRYPGSRPAGHPDSIQLDKNRSSRRRKIAFHRSMGREDQGARDGQV